MSVFVNEWGSEWNANEWVSENASELECECVRKNTSEWNVSEWVECEWASVMWPSECEPMSRWDIQQNARLIWVWRGHARISAQMCTHEYFCASLLATISCRPYSFFSHFTQNLSTPDHEVSTSTGGSKLSSRDVCEDLSQVTHVSDWSTNASMHELFCVR